MGAVVEPTDEEWGLVEHLLDPPVKATIPRRDIVDAILWLARTGCQWRYLPDRFPDRQAASSRPESSSRHSSTRSTRRCAGSGRS